MAESSGKAWKRLLENKDPEQVEQGIIKNKKRNNPRSAFLDLL